MKIAIIFESKTGNTALIANAIREELSGDVVYFGAPKDNIDADLYVVGSWIDKGSSVSAINDLLGSLKGKKVACFATCGFGSSDEYNDRIMSRMSEFVPKDSEIVGVFCCQGKMPISVRDRYVSMIKANPDDKHLEVAIHNFDEALSHPDERDIANAKMWIRSVINMSK